MSSKLPFEDAFERQMKDVPSPDMEASWQKMKQLMDDKKEAETPVVYRRSVLLTVAAILLLVIAGYLISNEINLKTGGSEKIARNTKADSNMPLRDGKIVNQNSGKQKSSSGENVLSDSLVKKGSLAAKEITTAAGKSIASSTRKSAADKSIALSTRKSAASTITSAIRKSSTNTINAAGDDITKKTVSTGRNAPLINKGLQLRNTAIAKTSIDETAVADSAHSDSYASNYDRSKEASLVDQLIDVKVKTGIDNAQPLSITPTLPITGITELSNQALATKKVLAQKSKKYVVTAGIGVQQQIPIGGQKIVTERFNGRSAVSDYIPSLFMRLEKQNKWYLQTEFIYSSPQLIDQFSYFRKTTVDSVSIETTTLNLKKVFFNKIPLTFNYYVRPGLTVGAGAMYGWLNGAISEKETRTNNLQTLQSTVAKETNSIKGYTDSFLYKSHTYLLLQSEYQWRNLSFGIRYSKDMEPYIKYTMPNGVVQDKRNWSLELILRLKLLHN